MLTLLLTVFISNLNFLYSSNNNYICCKCGSNCSVSVDAMFVLQPNVKCSVYIPDSSQALFLFNASMEHCILETIYEGDFEGHESHNPHPYIPILSKGKLRAFNLKGTDCLLSPIIVHMNETWRKLLAEEKIGDHDDWSKIIERKLSTSCDDSMFFVKIHFETYNNGRLSMNTELENPNSQLYSSLKQDIEFSLENEFENVGVFAKVTVIKFSAGSVVSLTKITISNAEFDDTDLLLTLNAVIKNLSTLTAAPISLEDIQNSASPVQRCTTIAQSSTHSCFDHIAPKIQKYCNEQGICGSSIEATRQSSLEIFSSADKTKVCIQTILSAEDISAALDCPILELKQSGILFIVFIVLLSLVVGAVLLAAIAFIYFRHNRIPDPIESSTNTLGPCHSNPSYNGLRNSAIIQGQNRNVMRYSRDSKIMVGSTNPGYRHSKPDVVADSTYNDYSEIDENGQVPVGKEVVCDDKDPNEEYDEAHYAERYSDLNEYNEAYCQL